MNEELKTELLSFIRENLTIQVSDTCDYYNTIVKVSLVLNDEIISSDYFTLPLKD